MSVVKRIRFSRKRAFRNKDGSQVFVTGGPINSFAQSKFEAGLDEFAERFSTEQMVLFVRVLSREVLNRLDAKSPVRTGRFRSAWVVGRGAPNRSAPEEPDPNWYEKAMSEINNLKPGERLYISNNLDYALMLEYGWSSQAPEGVVAVTMAEIEAWLQSNRKTPVDGL